MPSIATQVSFRTDKSKEAQIEFDEKLAASVPILPNAKLLADREGLIVSGERPCAMDMISTDIFWIDQSSACPKLNLRSSVNIVNAGILIVEVPLTADDLTAIRIKGISGVFPKIAPPLDDYFKQSLASISGKRPL